ncbi:MAG: hypothetical protein RR415_10460, partial [Ruthenibacterium sp.]
NQILNEQAIISEQSEKVKFKFTEMFGGIKNNVKIGSVAPFQTSRITAKDLSTDEYITTDNMLQNKKGIVPYAGTLGNVDSVVKYQCNDILVSNIRPYLKKIWLADKNGGCSADILVFHIIDSQKYLPEYVYYALYQDEFFEFMMDDKKGLKMPRGDKNIIPDFLIYDADIDLQQSFVSFVKSCDKLKFEAKKRLDSLKNARESLVDKYFR